VALVTIMAAFSRVIGAVVGKIAGGLRNRASQLVAGFAEARIHRARLEAELYRYRCRLRSKSDDDLPIIGEPHIQTSHTSHTSHRGLT